MPRTIKLIGVIAPFSVVILLCWTVIESTRLINPSLRYVGPRNQLPEDVYGFGFAGVWIALLPIFACLCVLSRYLLGQSHRAYWVALIGAYAACSIAGFWLDHVIWLQIIG